MEPVDLRDFYSGGYFLLRAGHPDWPPPFGELLPDGNVISLAKCICRRRLSILWGWIPGDRDAAIDFGIPESHLEEFLAWCGEEYKVSMDLISMFYSPEAARACAKRFNIEPDNLLLIGAALPKELHKAWVEEEPSTEGIAKRVKQAVPVDMSGKPLGYDVVTYSYTDFAHSWLCNGLEHDMNQLFGMRTNDLGLLDSYTDAKKINDWIAADENRPRVEPEPYDFWLLLSYPLNT